MKYQFYFPKEDHCDCVLRTFMKLLNKSYDDVKKDLLVIAQDLGYEKYNEINVFEKYFLDNGYSKIDGDNSLVKDYLFDEANYGVFCFKDDDYHLIPIIKQTIYDKNEKLWDMKIISLYKK